MTATCLDYSAASTVPSLSKELFVSDGKKVTGSMTSDLSTAASSQCLHTSNNDCLLSSRCTSPTPSYASNAATPKIHGAGVGTFHVQSKLGGGSFGTVYHVEEKKTGRGYAMKVMRKETFRGAMLRYAIAERNVQSSVSFPFIVGLACAFQTSHELVLVMPLCPGGNLASLAEAKGGLPEQLCRSYFSEVFLAIEHLHACDTVYRDLKCENVVLDEGNHAMLTDFGLAKQNVENTQSTSFLGSVCYIAPEILSRQGHGKPVDIYGLGAVLFETLTARPPFSGQCLRDICRNIQTAELEIPSFASDDCASILRALMARNPERRLGAASTTDVRAHPFLASVDFDAVLRREAHIAPTTPETIKKAQNATTPIPVAFDQRRSALRHQHVAGWDFPAETGRATRCRGACLLHPLIQRTRRVADKLLDA